MKEKQCEKSKKIIISTHLLAERIHFVELVSYYERSVGRVKPILFLSAKTKKRFKSASETGLVRTQEAVEEKGSKKKPSIEKEHHSTHHLVLSILPDH